MIVNQIVATFQLPEIADGVNGPVTMSTPGPSSITTTGPVTLEGSTSPTLLVPSPLSLSVGDGDPTIEVDC